MNEEMLTITVMIANRSYRVKVKRNEEVIYREAAKKIEERLNIYGGKYRIGEDKDENFFLSMVALELAVSYLKLYEEKNVTPLIDKIEELNRDLADYLEV